MSDIFISYSRHDSDVVNELVTMLEQEGYSVWIDRDGIESGDDFKRIILKAIKESIVVLFFSSEHSNVSDWTAKEIGVAVKYKKHIIPVMLDESNFNEAVEFDLINLDYVDYSKASTRLVMRERLLKALRSKLGVGSKKDERLEAERKAKAEAERARLEKERLAKAEAERRAREAAERERIERERKAEEARRKAEQERVERERREAERKAKEKAGVSVGETTNGFVFTVNGVSFNMVKVEGGTFLMGADNGKIVRKGLFKDRIEINSNVTNFDPDAYEDEKPVHNVTVSSFYLGETVVTQALWKVVMGTTIRHQMAKDVNSNPRDLVYEGDDFPMVYVSWNDCQEFINKLNGLVGKNFRLPTEAEWEYAARGGKKSTGNKYSGSNRLGDVGWYNENSGEKLHLIKGKLPNELRLYDMSGNVNEWCYDWYGDYENRSQINPTGPASNSRRVVRGGDFAFLTSVSFDKDANRCRVTSRDGIDPNKRWILFGFRLAFTV